MNGFEKEIQRNNIIYACVFEKIDFSQMISLLRKVEVW